MIPINKIANLLQRYNKNSNIELKKIEDSFASAANYIKKIGWKKNEPCFYKVELKEGIPSKSQNLTSWTEFCENSDFQVKKPLLELKSDFVVPG